MQTVSLLLLAAVAVAKRSEFQMMPKWNDCHLPQQYKLGSPTTYNPLDQCAQQCARATQCSLFSFNREVQTCQLYGDIVYFDETLTPQSPGMRYYAYRTGCSQSLKKSPRACTGDTHCQTSSGSGLERSFIPEFSAGSSGIDDPSKPFLSLNDGWCPLNSGFFMLRSANICVKLMTDKKTYDNANLICNQLGARLVVLEDEDKATAGINLLATLGLSDNFFHIGATDRITDNQFVWADGRLRTRDWWSGSEPNGNLVENCANLKGGGMYDMSCNANHKFICETPQ